MLFIARRPSEAVKQTIVFDLAVGVCARLSVRPPTCESVR